MQSDQPNNNTPPAQTPQTVVGRNPDHGPGPGRQKPSSKWLTGILLGIGAIAAVVYLGPLLLFFGMLAVHQVTSGGECGQGRKQLYADRQRLSDAFNADAFLPGATSSAVSVKTNDGDCFDSLPTVYLEKSYTVSNSAGSLLDAINAKMIEEGYKDENPEDPRYCFSNNEGTSGIIDARYVLADNQDKHKDSQYTVELTCQPTTRTKDYNWRSTPITQATIKQTVEWRYSVPK